MSIPVGIHVTVEASQTSPDSEDVTMHFKNLPPGRAQIAAKLASDLSTALADGKLDLMEDLQLALDVKAIVKPA